MRLMKVYDPVFFGKWMQKDSKLANINIIKKIICNNCMLVFVSVDADRSMR